MGREKEIEEMANILWHIPNNYFLNSYNDCERIAECIYDDGGYRKQNIGKWVMVGEGITERVVCSNCNLEKGSFMKPPFCNQCGAIMKGGSEWKDGYKNNEQL